MSALINYGTYGTTGTNLYVSQPTQELSTAKRVFYTLDPIASSICQITGDLINGKSVKEAWDGVTDTFERVHDANREALRENIHRNAELVRESRIMKYTATGRIIQKLDEWVNKYYE